MELSLRKATKYDADLTFKIEKFSIKEYSDAVYQTLIDNHRKEFDSTNIQIIELGQNAIGYLEIDDNQYCFEIINILIQQKFQNKGYGKQIIENLISEGRKVSKGIELQVLKNNPKAKRFYQNVGFQVYFETDFEYKMKFSHANRHFLN